ncbi:MAG: 6-aminohexanoate-dimer hydrolase [Owenweeksia sp. TMED14]|nr:MAG: 6-aminohexanoate-dimer hydrolase [Owenweeksia sp. TMED14]
MKRIIKTFITLAILLFLVNTSWYSYIFKGIYATYLQGNTTANIFDGTSFKKGKISAQNPTPWPVKIDSRFTPSLELSQVLSTIETGAFLIFDNDTLRHEQYNNKVSQESKTNSFSMSKSIVAILVQIAIQDGEIKGWDEPVINLIPELNGPGRELLTLANLAGMTANIDWDENYYNPLGVSAKAYYGTDLYKTIISRSIGADVGVKFEYQSASTALLGFYLEAATGRKIYEYASEKLWTPLGAVSDAFWHLDDSGNALTYCCYNATARDYGRLGKLILQNGQWEGNRLVDADFLRGATTPGSEQYYGLSFWLGEAQTSDGEPMDPPRSYIAFHGHLGQWIIILPDLNRVIVRTGHQDGDLPINNGKQSPFILTVQEYSKLPFFSWDKNNSVEKNSEVINDTTVEMPEEKLIESDALPVNNGDLDL